MTAARRVFPAAVRRDFRSPPRPPAAVAADSARGRAPFPSPPFALARSAPPPFGGVLRPRSLAVAAALLATLVPAACGERRDRTRLAALEAGVASARASLAVLSAAPPAAPPPVPGDASMFRSVGTAAAAAPLVPGARPVSASGLVGAEPDALRRWFGDPDLRRPEGDAEVRLYLGPGCALDVVLYAGAAGGGGSRVFHAAARADGAAAVTEADCLRGVGAGRGAGRAAAAGHSGRR